MNTTPSVEPSSGREPPGQVDAAERLWRLWGEGGRPDVGAFLASAGLLSPAQAAAVLRVDQRKRWQAGERVPAEAYLQRRPDVGADAEGALDLIFNEFLIRERLGEKPEPGEYTLRFPAHSRVLKDQIDLHRAMAADPGRTVDEPARPPREEGTRNREQQPGGLQDRAPSFVPAASTWIPSGAPTPSAPAALEGHPRYRILELLGVGGMGAVFKAQHLLMERTVALKVINPNLIDQPDAVKRFRREVKAAAKLTHPNIVTAYDAEQAGDVHFLVMEYVEGASLARLVDAQGPLPPARACDYVRQAALGLQHAFEKGMVHRDIKPHNLMLTPTGQVKMLDFGLARFAQESRPAGAQGQPEAAASLGPSDESLTHVGVVLGTPLYMAPEQVRDAHAADIRADIYSLGCTLYDLLAGHAPFLEAMALRKAPAHLEPTPRPLTEVWSGVPPELAKVVARMMAKDPAQRYQTPGDAAAALLPFTGAAPSPRSRRRRETILSLAVLPLVNTSGNPDTEYLSDGITESIINCLSQLPKLRVMARSTVFRYKGREVDAQEVGRALKVRAVLTGQLFQRGNRLIIMTELVDARDGSRLWGEHYDRELSEIFAIEKAIAQEIAEKLRLRLTGEQKKRLGQPLTENTEAYQCYLKGRYHSNKRTEEGLKKSIKLFEQAIDQDPAYALAYTGVADAYQLLGGWGYLPCRDAYPCAKVAATRALALDDQLAEAHVSLAMVKKEYDWDWPGAGREYRRALELNPNYAVAYQWYGEYLAALAQHPQAIAAIQRAIELDPLSLISHSTLGRHGYYFARQYDQAVAQLHKTLEMDGNFWMAHYFLGWVYACSGRLTEALPAFHTALRLDGNLEIVAALGHTHALAGQRLEAQRTLDDLRQLSEKRNVSPMLSAIVAIGLGEYDQAFAWLEKAYEDRIQWLSEMKVDPLFDPLRTDPRFADLLRRVGLGVAASQETVRGGE